MGLTPPGISRGSRVLQAQIPRQAGRAADDVWWFVRQLDTAARPATRPPDTPSLLEKPDPKVSAYLGCRLCELPAWRTWKNTAGQIEAIRTHLKKNHEKEWRDEVIQRKLKGWQELSGFNFVQRRRHSEPFTKEGFRQRLLAWVVVDDQSLNVVDCDEFRELLLYVGDDNLDNSDIPHRTKLKQLLTARFSELQESIASDAQNALGRVSFTSDLWTDHQLRGFMAITLHFCAKDSHRRLCLQARLGAFRHVRGSHSGANLAAHFLEVIKQMGLLSKIGMITLDNASNCSTMMEELERLLHEKGIPFDREGNRIRCFPHVVNISVQKGIKQLTSADEEVYHDEDSDSESVTPDEINNSALQADIEYAQALCADPVAQVRALVAACRASQQRREDFSTIIVNGNRDKMFGPEPLRNLQLARDVDTRWSSTFIMIDRVLELYQAIDLFLKQSKHESIAWHALSSKTLEVLDDIREFLEAPHAVQELLSAEKTPTLCLVLPAYEKLILLLKLLKRKLPKIAYAISMSIAKVEEYLSKSRKTRIYTVAVVLNPSMKFEWLTEHWSREDCTSAHTWLRDSMLEFRRTMRSTRSANPDPPHSTNARQPAAASSITSPASALASRSQRLGLKRVNAMIRSLSADSRALTATEWGPMASPPTAQETTEAERQEAERRARERDERIVDNELHRYIDAGLVDDEDEDFDILKYWETHEREYPTLYRAALDVLPVQASAVPCERVFSSSKDTDTSRRSSLDPETMEMLQVIKYSLRQDRLSFTDDWLPNEHEMLRDDALTIEADTLD